MRRRRYAEGGMNAGYYRFAPEYVAQYSSFQVFGCAHLTMLPPTGMLVENVYGGETVPARVAR